MEERQSSANGKFEVRAFGKDVLVYSAGSAFLLLSGFIQVFLIAKYIPVKDYGYWQLFMLYANYAGLLSLGFIDGILVRWAGKEIAQIDNELRGAFRFLVLEQVVVILPLTLFLYFFMRTPLQWIWLMILAFAFIINIATFFTFTAQAVRKFGFLTTVTVCRGLAFLIFVVVLFETGHLNYHYVVFAFLISYLFLLFPFVFWLRKNLWGSKSDIPRLLDYGRKHINIGVFVLLGNYVVVLFLTIDRLLVSSLFAIGQFAVYAFALAIVSALYTFVKAISEVFFPYLTGVMPQLRSRAYRLVEPAIVLIWASVLIIYFPITRLIEYYLPAYVDSLPLLQILFCTVGFGSLIQILQVNYFKVYRKQRQYFLWGIMALAISVTLNFLAIKIWGTLGSVAAATLISFGIWYILNERSLMTEVGKSSVELCMSIAVLCSYVGIFWLTSFLVDFFVAQILIYVCFFCLVTWFFLRHEARELVMATNKVIKQR